jgi:head-tail adaptor
MRTARTLEAEWRQVLRVSVITGAKEDESSTGRVWVGGFHHVTARSRLARVLKLMSRLFL